MVTVVALVWSMAFRVVRLRREARRNAKLEEIFTVRDSKEYVSQDHFYISSGER